MIAMPVCDVSYNTHTHDAEHVERDARQKYRASSNNLLRHYLSQFAFADGTRGTPLKQLVRCRQYCTGSQTGCDGDAGFAAHYSAYTPSREQLSGKAHP